MSHTTPASHQEDSPSSKESPGELAADHANMKSFSAGNKIFEAALRSIINRCYEPPKTPNNLYYEFLACVYQKLFFAQPCESHVAFHALNILHKDERMPEDCRHAIRMVLESQMMAIPWKVYTDFEHASANQAVLQYKHACPDTATFAIRSCPEDCLMELVRIKAITASGFNSAGQSFFHLAFLQGRLDIAHELLLRMSVEHILEPACITADGRQQTTILQMSVMNATLFNACWTKIESDPDLNLSNVLEHAHFAYVCGFATEDLAMRMLARGIDLANTVRAFPYDTWPRMAQYQPSPAPFFSWPMQRECWPYSIEAGDVTPLLVAAQHDRLEATRWLLCNNFSACEQKSCAVAAAVRQTKDSASILHLVVMRMSLAVPPHLPSWAQDIACKVVQAACNQDQMDGAEILQFIQDLAIQKLRCVTEFAPDSLVYSKESLLSAEKAGLTDLVNFLRAGNKKALTALKDELRLAH
ncbi:hypothetical protein N7494_000553 [Penicillium frequentans]|uniref:Uncharacterized protein n=1 Tax=Penicillium frequentans TaxID=3151616 RepID=A0AAD6GLG4_9EURO|nr:hypothetical protein N7494_000553 [Penicillium glabrum]